MMARTRNLHVFEMLELALAASGANSFNELVRAYFPCYVDLIAVGQRAQPSCHRTAVLRMKAISPEVLKRRLIRDECGFVDFLTNLRCL
jgi:hypothetical protein